MGIKDFFISLFSADGTLDLSAVEAGNLSAGIFYKELAIQASVNLIANAVSRSEFVTYQKGNPVRQDNYYLFNVQANQNKSASKFWRDVVHKLVYDNECLVVMPKGMAGLYVADSFDKSEFALKDNEYKNIKINDYILRENLKEKDVFHFELHDQKIKTIIDSLYQGYGELIGYSESNYKRSNAKRGALEIPASYPQTDQAQASLEKLLNERIRRFFEAESGAVIPLTNGIKYQDLSTSGYKSGSDSRDVKQLIDDVFQFVAIGFQIPPSLLLGNVADTEKAVNNFLAFCVNPIAELITDEINRKYYTKKEYLERTYVKLDTSLIKVADIKDIANALDVMFRIGVNTINDNLKFLGREPIADPIADKRFITKNYTDAESFLRDQNDQGGGAI